MLQAAEDLADHPLLEEFGGGRSRESGHGPVAIDPEHPCVFGEPVGAVFRRPADRPNVELRREERRALVPERLELLGRSAEEHDLGERDSGADPGPLAELPPYLDQGAQFVHARL